MDRINKYIASCGICSRRKAEEYVLAGRVKVNDIIIKDLAYKVKEELQSKGIRVEVDDRNEKTGYKIREAQLQKIPYMLIVGEKEVEGNTVSIRSREDGDIGTKSVEKFTEDILKKIEEKS